MPSWNQLAKLVKVSTTTITAMIDGQRETSTDVIQAVADVLRVDPSDISKWLKLSRPVTRRYVAPPEADLLSTRQQKALTTFIRALAADKAEAPQADVIPFPGSPEVEDIASRDED